MCSLGCMQAHSEVAHLGVWGTSSTKVTAVELHGAAGCGCFSDSVT